MIDPLLWLAASILLVAFTALAAVDGLYIHLWKLRLHERPEARREHQLHTVRGVLFPLIVLTLFVAPTGGLLLWAGAAIAIADTGVELWDVFVERDSRALLGGVGSFEAVVHAILISLRAASLALIVAARPALAWSLDAPLMLDAQVPALARLLTVNLLVGIVVLAGLHVWLGLRGPRAVTAAR